jgi:uncharacterized protein DUF4926
MTKAKRYDTVVLLEDIAGFQKGARGAVVEVYTTPYEAYDVEIVTDEGETRGIAEAIRPREMQVVPSGRAGVRFASIRIEEDGTRAAISFSDGTRVTVRAEEMYTRKE